MLYATLNNGVRMPMLGLGVWQIPNGPLAELAVASALAIGYRSIDTAMIYGNEESVGRAVKKSGIARSELFITTKLWPTDFLRAESAFEKSLNLLGAGYIDLYLMHWPVPAGKQKAWKTLEKLYFEGRIKAIGVSNYNEKQLTSLLQISAVVPAVNQVEFSPFRYREDLLEFCQTRNIQLEAYSPLTRARRLHDDRVLAIARGYGKSASQLMLRWALQHGVVVIPKAQDPRHQKENFELFDFEISETDMSVLDACDENYRTVLLR